MSADDSSVEYRPVPGFPAYKVGSDGTLWSRFGKSRGGFKHDRLLVDEWHKIDMAPKPEGYVLVCLYGGGRRRYVRLHVLVLEVFRGPRPAGQECCHRNGIRSDCALSNLRYGTRSSNHLDKRLHGTSAAGERNPQAKLTEDQVRAIFARRADGLSYSQLGLEFGLSPTYAWSIISGETWGHLGLSTGRKAQLAS